MFHPRHQQHLTHCWCWEPTDHESIRAHLLWHAVQDKIEDHKIHLIALEVATWGPPKNKPTQKTRDPLDGDS